MINKNQSYIIAGMTILIVVLCWFLYNSKNNIEVYKKQTELNDLNIEKKSAQKKTDSIISDISESSTKSVEKSILINKLIKHETPKIIDTTDAYMYEYIVNYRPTR